MIYRIIEPFVVPPENQGQSVQVAYALGWPPVGHAAYPVVIRQTIDRAENKLPTYSAAVDAIPGEEWQPWNMAPAVESPFSPCEVETDIR